MTFRMIVQLWNTNTPVFVSCDADQTENYMYISMKFGTGVHVFCWQVGVFNRSSFQSVSCNTFSTVGDRWKTPSFKMSILKYVKLLVLTTNAKSHVCLQVLLSFKIRQTQ